MIPSEVIALLRIDLFGELVLATLLGGLIGLEREISGKPAGLRTNILICVGATLISDLSMDLALGTRAAGGVADPARLAAQIISGVGFLGAGTIIQARGTVTGLTSAATLWVVAAIGIGIGTHHTAEAIVTAGLVLIVLLPLGFVEHRLSLNRRIRSIYLEIDRENDGVEGLITAAIGCGLTLRSENLEVNGKVLRIRLDMAGTAAAWRACREELGRRPEVRALRVT